MPKRGGEFSPKSNINTSESTATKSPVETPANPETGASNQPEAPSSSPVESATARVIDITDRLSSRNKELSNANGEIDSDAKAVLGEIGKDTLGIVPQEAIKETPSRQALELAQAEGDTKIGDKITAFGNKYVPEAWLANKIKENGGIKGILKSALSYFSDKATERQETRRQESKAQKSTTAAETSPNPESAQAKNDAKVEAYRKKIEAEHSASVQDEANSMNTLRGNNESSSSSSVESAASATTSGTGAGGNFINLDTIDTGNEAWDAQLRQSREKAEAKAQRAHDRRFKRQARKEQRMLERRQNWAELKDNVNKKWFIKLGKKAFKFARKTAAITKGMYEGGRAAHAQFNEQSAPTPPPETSPTAHPVELQQPSADNVFSLDAARERRQAETTATAEKSPESTEKELTVDPDTSQTMYNRRSDLNDDEHTGSIRLRSVPSAEKAA